MRRGEHKLTAYQTLPREVVGDRFKVVAAPHRRDWMDTSYNRSAYRCLPLLIANQAGWMILNPSAVRFKWDGAPNLDAIEIERWVDLTMSSEAMQDYLFPSSHFGSGVITWTLPFLFRTPPGYNLLARGPANHPKDGAAPLEGIIETDWTPATFTMNWKITRTNEWITFAKGEPICMIVPQRRHELEEFIPEIRLISDNPDLHAANQQWCTSRDQFNEQFKNDPTGWEKHYFQGTSPDGTTAPDHQTRLHLREFRRRVHRTN
jgi:hypothetical protein